MAAQIEISIVDNSPASGGDGGTGGGGGGTGGGRSGGVNDPDMILTRIEVRARKQLEVMKRADDRQSDADEVRLARLAEASRKQLERMKKADDKQKAADDLVLARIEVQSKKKLDRMRTADERQEKLEQKREDAEANKTKAETEKSQMVAGVAAAGAVAAIIRGGGPGAVIGGGIGSAIGGRFGGASGAILGGAVGEKLGGAADKAIPSAGAFGARVARSEGVGIAADAASSLGNVAAAGAVAASGLAAMSVVAAPLAPALLAAGVGAFALGKAVGAGVEVLNAFAARGKELAGYSGQIAGAAANQDISRLLMDIREGQRLGGGYAGAIEAQTKLELTLQAGLLPIKEWILERLPKSVDVVLDILMGILEAANVVADQLGSAAVAGILDEMKRVRRALESGALPGIDAIFDKWLEPMGVRPVAGVPVAGPLDVPLLRAP